jgi:hypothetical protein
MGATLTLQVKVDSRARELLATNGYLQRLFSFQNQ